MVCGGVFLRMFYARVEVSREVLGEKLWKVNSDVTLSQGWF